MFTRMAQSMLDIAALAEARDCLVNVDIRQQPFPSARFMGGREIEMLIDIGPDQDNLLSAVAGVIESGAMVLPTLAPGCGPFPDNRHH